MTDKGQLAAVILAGFFCATIAYAAFVAGHSAGLRRCKQEVQETLDKIEARAEALLGETDGDRR